MRWTLVHIGGLHFQERILEPASLPCSGQSSYVRVNTTYEAAEPGHHLKSHAIMAAGVRNFP